MTLAVGRGVAEDEITFGGMSRDDSGGPCFLADFGRGTGDGLGERGIMPSDFSAAITL